MNKKRILPLALGSLGLIVAIFYLASGGQSDEETAHDHADHAEAGHDHEAESGEEVESDIRRPELLDDPAYQEPAAEPLVRIVSKETLLSNSEISYMAPRISADGKHLIVTGNRYKGLWVANRDGTGLKKISDGDMAGWRPVSTTHGELIYRTKGVDADGNPTFTMHLYNLETGETEVIYEGVNEDLYPAWLSRDEDFVLMLRDGDIVPHQLRAVEGATPITERDEGIAYSDGGEVRYRHLGADKYIPLSSESQATGGEVASPTGQHVAYLSGNLNSALIVNLETGEEVNIGEGSNLAWSPKGDLLLYDVTSDDGHNILGSQLFVVGPDGENRQRVTFDGGAYHNPSWSPDGKYIVAENLDTGEVVKFDVDVMNDRTQ